MRKLSKKWVHTASGTEYTLVDSYKVPYGSHEIITLAPSESVEQVVVRSTMNVYDEFKPLTEENHENAQ